MIAVVMMIVRREQFPPRWRRLGVYPERVDVRTVLQKDGVAPKQRLFKVEISAGHPVRCVASCTVA